MCRRLLTVVFALTAALLATAASAQQPKGGPAPAAAQKAAPVSDLSRIAVDLRSAQSSLPSSVVAELHQAMVGVGCPEWTGEDRWGTSSANQFRNYLRRTGQVRNYEELRQPSIADVRRTLFKAWEPQADFISTLKSDVTYCEPQAVDIRIWIDLRRRVDDYSDTELPGGLPQAISKDLQRLMRSVGCPTWGEDDGKWGPSSSGQFATFLEKTGQDKVYNPNHGPLVGEIRALFAKWQPEDDFVPTLNTKVNYCQPFPGGGVDEDKKTKIDFDLRNPQPKLPEPQARSAQQLLLKVGCPQWGKEQGKWGPSSSGQFRQFLKKTEQEGRYSGPGATMAELKKLFVGWIPEPEFQPDLNTNSNYCQPIPRCNLNNEIGKLLDSSGEAKAMRDMFLSIYGWTRDSSRQQQVQRTLLDKAGDEPLADLKERIADTENELRSVFMRIVETNLPDSCGLCTQKRHYEIALSVGLDRITQDQIKLHERLWRDVEVLKRSISTKDTLKQAKARAILEREYMKQVRSSDAREVERLNRLLAADTKTVEELTGLIEQEQIYLGKLIEPVAKGIQDEILKARAADPPSDPAAEFRTLMESTTCFVGDGPYVKK